MDRYQYNHIEIIKINGLYHADYVRPNGTRFILHRASCDTKAKAMAEARANIDVLNLLNGWEVA